MKKVLFICWYNSARSQMAEGLLRQLGGDKFYVYSAGIENAEIRPEAVEAMKEIGIDISGQKSKTTKQFEDQEFDEVITVCHSADKACPIFHGAKNRRHWEFEDPEKAEGTDDEKLQAYRDARDAIKAKIEEELV